MIIQEKIYCQQCGMELNEDDVCVRCDGDEDITDTHYFPTDKDLEEFYHGNVK